MSTTQTNIISATDTTGEYIIAKRCFRCKTLDHVVLIDNQQLVNIQPYVKCNKCNTVRAAESSFRAILKWNYRQDALQDVDIEKRSRLITIDKRSLPQSLSLLSRIILRASQLRENSYHENDTDDGSPSTSRYTCTIRLCTMNAINQIISENNLHLQLSPINTEHLQFIVETLLESSWNASQTMANRILGILPQPFESLDSQQPLV